MRVIAWPKLREFSRSRKGDSEIAERDLATWYKLAESARWANFASLKRTFRSADLVGECVVFDVGNNRYRVIGKVSFSKGKIYILAVMDHQEYDKHRWVDDCHCHKPPPKKSTPHKRQKGR